MPSANRKATNKEAVPDETGTAERRLAVLGSPIGHSQSPALHRAAYEALSLPWRYESVEVTSEALAAFIDGCGPEWRGLSLTMPLKQTVMPLLDSADRVATLAGTANTLLFKDAGSEDKGERRLQQGFNTDVAGIVRALAAVGFTEANYVHILGGGATAASAMVAAAELGAERVLLSVRSVERSAWLEPLAHTLGLRIAMRPLGIADRSLIIPELVISTLPGGSDTGTLFTASTRRSALLFDVAYDPWPSDLARAWEEVGGRVLSGLPMLAHQALLQVRVFVSGDPLEPLPNEETVLDAMLEAVGLDAATG